ncbi:hypothetical protein HY501_00610 [Candidatus Woesearchaeota archaeon]|nr:hypothetical protein [Candidatus Woesearchaeota archaeon]
MAPFFAGIQMNDLLRITTPKGSYAGYLEDFCAEENNFYDCINEVKSIGYRRGEKQYLLAMCSPEGFDPEGMDYALEMLLPDMRISTRHREGLYLGTEQVTVVQKLDKTKFRPGEEGEYYKLGSLLKIVIPGEGNEIVAHIIGTDSALKYILSPATHRYINALQLDTEEKTISIPFKEEFTLRKNRRKVITTGFRSIPVLETLVYEE